MEKIQNNYTSPRWSIEITDCSMPMSLDTYSKCSYNCLYCFSYFQKSHNVEGYLNGPARSVNVDKIKKLFTNAMSDNRAGSGKTDQQFFAYIKDRRIMQWGGMADQFDENEKRNGVTLELLRFFDAIDYPLSFSTKSTWWTEDGRYMDLFSKHTHNWHVKVSIITLNHKLSKIVEKGVPSPSERLQAIKRLSDIGIHVTLRLRPYIIGISEDYPLTISEAWKAGADSMTVEYFCMESRADARLIARYKEIGKAAGYDVFSFYRKNSKQAGYKRLNRSIKYPVISHMREISKSLGMRFNVSDAFCRELNDSTNCCGVPPEWGVSQECNINKAILIAREKGCVSFCDIKKGINDYFDFDWSYAAGYNTSSNFQRALKYDMSMAQFLRQNWNNIKSGNSPGKGYGGILSPQGIDDNGDVVYKYMGRC